MSKFRQRPAILVCMILGVLALAFAGWNVSQKRAFEERQMRRGSLQMGLGNQLGMLLNHELGVTYASVTFDFIPGEPRILVHYAGLKSSRDVTAGATRQLHGDVVLNYQSPDTWLAAGSGDLAGINTSLKVASQGFPL